jgi:hypothetical protein
MELTAIIISAIALYFSYQSNVNSENALMLSKTQFLEENRPNIVVKPVRFDNTNSFCISEVHDNLIIMSIRFELKNEGNIAADNIVVDNVITKPENIKSYNIQFPEDFTLGPHQVIFVLVQYMFDYKDDIDKKRKLYLLNSDEWAGLYIEMKYTYMNGVDHGVRYSTVIGNLIKKYRAMLIKSKMDRL